MAGEISPLPVTASNMPSWVRSAAIIINNLLRAVAGLTTRATRTAAADTTITAKDYLIAADATAGNVTITLPTNADGKSFIIKRLDASANTLTISGAIDGATSKTLTGQWSSIALYGANGGFYAV